MSPNKNMPPHKVLFFGRNNCAATQTAKAHLEMLGFETHTILSSGRGEKLPEEVDAWQGDYIFCFRSLFILRKSVIERAKIAAINFHPAPVEYPGSGCINFALYDDADQYGVTCHIMNEKVDNGAIIECYRFPVKPEDNLDSLLRRTHQELLEQFLRVTTQISHDSMDYINQKIEASHGEAWNGEARRLKDLDALQIIPISAGEDEIKRVIRATYTPVFPPKIRLHGFTFELKSPKQIRKSKSRT